MHQWQYILPLKEDNLSIMDEMIRLMCLLFRGSTIIQSGTVNGEGCSVDQLKQQHLHRWRGIKSRLAVLIPFHRGIGMSPQYYTV